MTTAQTFPSSINDITLKFMNTKLITQNILEQLKLIFTI